MQVTINFKFLLTANTRVRMRQKYILQNNYLTYTYKATYVLNTSLKAKQYHNFMRQQTRSLLSHYKVRTNIIYALINQFALSESI